MVGWLGLGLGLGLECWWLGQVYGWVFLGWGWGEEGRTADQTSPCAVWRESDPSNAAEVYCDTPGWAAPSLLFASKTG